MAVMTKTNHKTLPFPSPGQILKFEYLYGDEYNDNFTDGEKVRPSMVLTANPTNNIVMLMAITKTPGYYKEKIPKEICISQNLDDRSHILVNEVNRISWPATIVHGNSNNYLIGFIPDDFRGKVHKMFLEHLRNNTHEIVDRV